MPCYANRTIIAPTPIVNDSKNVSKQVRFVLDINDIREKLDELTFRDGKREVFIGRISEMFGWHCGSTANWKPGSSPYLGLHWEFFLAFGT